MHFKILQAKQQSKKKHLSRPHSCFESGETVIKGAKNGDHAPRYNLTLLQRLSDKCGSLAQNFHRLLSPHWRWNLLGISPPMRPVGEKRRKFRCVIRNSTSLGGLFRRFQVSRGNAGTNKESSYEKPLVV